MQVSPTVATINSHGRYPHGIPILCIGSTCLVYPLYDYSVQLVSAPFILATMYSSHFFVSPWQFQNSCKKYSQVQQSSQASLSAFHITMLLSHTPVFGIVCRFVERIVFHLFCCSFVILCSFHLATAIRAVVSFCVKKETQSTLRTSPITIVFRYSLALFWLFNAFNVLDCVVLRWYNARCVPYRSPNCIVCKFFHFYPLCIFAQILN